VLDWLGFFDLSRRNRIRVIFTILVGFVDMNEIQNRNLQNQQYIFGQPNTTSITALGTKPNIQKGNEKIVFVLGFESRV
jgi:hypothetical protein